MLGIYVENGDQFAVRSKNGHHDLRACSGITGDVPRIFLDIGNDYGFPLRCRVAANAAAKSDVQAAKTSLIWSDTQQLPGLDHPVEPRQKSPECVEYECCDRGHFGYFVVDAIEDGVEVAFQLGIRAGLGDLSQIGDGLR